MRSIFDEKLENLHRNLSQMGRMVNEAIYKAVKSLQLKDNELAQNVISFDVEINEMEHKINQKCYEIIALEQPNTTDLRRVISVLRATADLERMGDHARSIAKVTIELKDSQEEKELTVKIISMGEKVNTMCTNIIDAFIENDLNKARQIAKKDTEIDEMYQHLRMLAINYMQEDSSVVQVAAAYSFVGMHLERIGDYIKNIGEGIIYLNTGKIVDFD